MAEPTSDPILNAFRETGAYLKGHFRLTSGLHSDEYLQCALVLQHPAIAERMGRELAALLPACDLIAAPALGGLIVGHEVARALGVRFIFTERDSSGKMTLRRGFSVTAGETAVVIEDVITTGGSTREVIELLQSHGQRAHPRRRFRLSTAAADDVELGVPRFNFGDAGSEILGSAGLSVVPRRHPRRETRLPQCLSAASALF